MLIGLGGNSGASGSVVRCRGRSLPQVTWSVLAGIKSDVFRGTGGGESGNSYIEEIQVLSKSTGSLPAISNVINFAF